MPHVLLVDDLELDRRALLQGLRNAGYTVSVSGLNLNHDSIEALRPDVALLGGGLGAIGRIKELIGPSVPLVLLSSSNDAAEREAVLRNGCSGYSPHAGDPEALAAQLAVLLGLPPADAARPKPTSAGGKRPLRLSTPAADADLGKRMEGVRVLVRVADDALRADLARLLRRGGMLVEEARDPEHAVELIEKKPFEVALIEASAEAGPGLLRRLRSRRSFQQLTLVALLPQRRSQDVLAALELGADEVAGFPPSLPELRRRLLVLTELRRARSASSRMQTAWRAASRGSEDLVALLDSEGRFIEVGGACEALLGVGPAALVGTLLRDWLHHYDRDADSGSFRREGKAMVRVQRLRRSDGSHRFFELRTEAIEDPAQPARSGLHLVARDVHERVQATAGDEPPKPGSYDGLSIQPPHADPLRSQVVVLAGGSQPLRQRGRVLLLHTEATVRDVISAGLERRGYAVRVAAGVSAALRLIDEDPPDAVLCDLEVPKLDRGQIEVALTARRGGAPPPLIAFSVYGFVEAAEAVGPVGIEGLLKELRRALRSALG